jgi:signal transduction histidine kinase
MRRLVDDLRDAARIGAGQFGVRRAPTDLVAVARQVAAELQATTRRHWIVVEAPARLEGRWDRDRVGQLLTNLVANAIRYAPDGGPIRIGLARRDDEAVLSVRDEGIGMSPEQIERLFRAFSRVHPDQPAQGLGLGLCIAKAIVDGHGGRIWVESAPGKGTTISAALPVGGERPEDARDPSTDDAGWQPAA